MKRFRTALIVGVAALACSAQTHKPAARDMNDRPARKLCDQPPCEYPTIALIFRQETVCTGKVNVDEDGRVTKADMSCPNGAFLRSATACAMVQRFRPAIRNGKFVPGFDFPLDIEFKLWRSDRDQKPHRSDQDPCVMS